MAFKVQVGPAQIAIHQGQTVLVTAPGQIEKMKPEDELYDAKLKVLQEQVLHHVEEEEGELFPQVEASGLDLEALGKKMAERTAALPSQ